MTIIATYRQGNTSIFVADFRVTRRPDGERVQQDLLLKFLSFGRVGLFLAGDVDFWRHAATRLKQVEQHISMSNLLDLSGPLNVTMNDMALAYRKCSPSAAIGFLIDKGISEQFVLDVCPGQGCVTQRLDDYKCTIRGSGASISGLSDAIANSVGDLMLKDEFDLLTLGSGMRRHIGTFLENEGKGAYRKYGISPVMATAWLNDGYFQINGEEILGVTHQRNDASHVFDYSITQSSSGSLWLTSVSLGTALLLKDILDYEGSMIEEIFDPERVSVP